MRMYKRLLYLLTVCLILPCGIARAQLLPGFVAQQDTDELTAGSDLVTVVAITAVKFDPDPPISGAPGLPMVRSGTFVLTPVVNVKGVCPDPLTIRLPGLNILAYDFNLVVIRPGDTVLVFLRQQASGFVPTSIITPYYPVDLPHTGAAYQGTAQEITRNMLFDTIADPELRPLTASLLMRLIGPDIVAGLTPYVHDTNSNVQSSALAGMAINGQLAAIPMIAALYDKPGFVQLPFNAPSLTYYKSKDAIPYLTPLLTNSSAQIRRQAAKALQQIGSD